MVGARGAPTVTSDDTSSSSDRRGLVAPGPLRAPLLVATAIVSLAGLCAELGEYMLGVPSHIVELFSLSYEANVPTWYATVLLFACSARLASIARAEVAHRARWAVLAALFAYISLDEAIQIHEYLGWIVEGRGVLYFAWVIPAAIVVVTIALAYVPFLRALDRVTRNRFVVAGALYVGGALLMELPLGWWTETYGDDNLGYGVIDWVEESMELAGASVFLLALHDEHTEVSA